MSSTDRITGRYTLETISGSCGDGNIFLAPAQGTGTVHINGNLIVVGTASRIQTQETVFVDNFITLSSNVAGAPVLDSGIEINRGIKPKVSIRYHEALELWQLTNDGITFANIYGKEPVMSRVSDDPTPVLGGNLNTNGFTIWSNPSQNIIVWPGVVANGANAAIEIRRLAPTANIKYKNQSQMFFAGNIGMGDTGLYTVNKEDRHEELVSKKRALIFSMIF
jgi:hypothetical protein